MSINSFIKALTSKHQDMKRKVYQAVNKNSDEDTQELKKKKLQLKDKLYNSKKRP